MIKSHGVLGVSPVQNHRVLGTLRPRNTVCLLGAGLGPLCLQSWKLGYVEKVSGRVFRLREGTPRPNPKVPAPLPPAQHPSVHWPQHLAAWSLGTAVAPKLQVQSFKLLPETLVA